MLSAVPLDCPCGITCAAGCVRGRARSSAASTADLLQGKAHLRESRNSLPKGAGC